MALVFPKPSKLTSLSILLLMIALALTPWEGNGEQQSLVFFLQDVATGPNATVAAVAGVKGKEWSYNTFGSIYVVDDPVTLGPNKYSAPVGRAQGLLATSSLDGSNVNVMISIVFTNLQYNGSTLQIQGVSRQVENYREVSVVSGTGRFRFARGFAALETLYYDPTTTYSIVRLTITLLNASHR
ncbi:dirigent protein 11-like [Prosopis cineraria]|uniref:dirigent protein 11-like n=1 Tax=Prosopis cineraria TaxID=364024 RepID=UPI00240F7332|nr:dirigent protein 11-like [Prosopis cineraria]